jgi:hypothetical protein
MVAGASVATLVFTNVMLYQVNATYPPVMKYPGQDVSTYSGPRYVTVKYQYVNGVNQTYFTIVGFTGDPTNYTSVGLICNYYYPGTSDVVLQAIGPVGSTTYLVYVKYLQVTITAPNGTRDYVQFTGATTSKASTGIFHLTQGQCATLGANVLVDPGICTAAGFTCTYPNASPSSRGVVGTYQVNAVITPR